MKRIVLLVAAFAITVMSGQAMRSLAMPPSDIPIESTESPAHQAIRCEVVSMGTMEGERSGTDPRVDGLADTSIVIVWNQGVVSQEIVYR